MRARDPDQLRSRIGGAAAALLLVAWYRLCAQEFSISPALQQNGKRSSDGRGGGGGGGRGGPGGGRGPNRGGVLHNSF